MMRICKQCQCPMEDGYKLKVNTYGSVKIERGTTRPDEIKAAVCPSCGEISLYLEKKN